MDLLQNRLQGYLGKGMCSFHTPGHKGRKDLFSPDFFPDYDLTELPGLDMLHNPQGVIAEAQRRAAAVYGSDEAYFLVNGGTVGNQAMFAALMQDIRMRGKKIRIDRKSHRSVYSALILSGLQPEYIEPVIHPEFQLALGFDAKKFTTDSADIGAYHITSPSYYGTTADLESIIEERDSQFPGIPLLVDQAHGAHFWGRHFPAHAIRLGADMVVFSAHKTLAALTQSGMLHVQGQRIARTALKSALELLQTSSPSYLLMTSLEAAVNGLTQAAWDDLHEEVCNLHRKLNGRLRLLAESDHGQFGIHEVDWTKILLNISHLDVSIKEAITILRHKYHVEPELWDERNILFMLGVGNTPEDVKLLTQALTYLADNYSGNPNALSGKEQAEKQLPIPPMHLTPREAWQSPKRKIKLKQALGKISAETVSIYPPGIPLVAAGEEITPPILAYLLNADNYRWQGWDGFEAGEIQVIDI
ncbi:amino acid decarboxylase [Dehalobacter sp. DCM]|uniref:aminotransferase class I/II-fold pyridoxal phosphate-dependent enzyme n=1 Tax=Dehalobacter sp. DCM TaxID=2907827 RepID=UPI0030814256|nr:amino acid decarboxylase [Dehalobacter sp. DCM]